MTPSATSGTGRERLWALQHKLAPYLFVSPFVIRYTSGVGRRCNFGGIWFGVGLELRAFLERSNSLLEMKYFPKGDAHIQEPHAAHRPAHPSRRDHGL